MSIGSFPGDIMRWNVPWQLRLKHGWCMFYPDICLYNIKTWLNLFLALSFLSWYICRMSSFWLVWPNLHAESRGGLEYMGWRIGSVLRSMHLGQPLSLGLRIRLQHTLNWSFYVAYVEEGPSYHSIVIEPLSVYMYWFMTNEHNWRWHAVVWLPSLTLGNE